MIGLLWWFGQNTLTVLLLVPCVMLACRLFRNRPAVQHLLWLVILVKFITPPIVAWPWGVDDLQSMLGMHDSSVQVTAVEPMLESPHPEIEALPIELPNSASENLATAEPSDSIAIQPVTTDVVSITPQQTTPVQWGSVITVTTLTVWLIGAIACFFVQMRRWLRYAHLVRVGVAAPSHLIEEVASLATLLRIKAPVCIVAKGIASPFLWCAGTIRLAWPESLSSPDDVVRSRGIIAHELAHLRRRDHWITWLELGASVLWWWNPLFWFVRRRLREAAEMSCDALAIAANPECRHDYAEQLLQLSIQTPKDGPAPVLAVGTGDAASFERRLKMILSSKVSGKLSVRGTLAMVFLAVIALPFWSLAQSAANPQGTDEAHKLPPQPAANDDEEESTSRTFKYKFVDGESGTPLQGMEFTFGTWSKAPAPANIPLAIVDVLANDTDAKSSADGIVEITVREGESPYLVSTPPGWLKDAETTMIDVVLPGMSATDDDTNPKTIKLWRGTTVSGTLLWPDGKPAANIPLNAGVYINHQTWKARLGIDLTFRSFDRGDWPNWNSRILTDANGRFRVTVPPAKARAWLRIGTTSLSFGSSGVIPNEPDSAKRLAKCSPLEYQVGGHAATVPVISDGSRTDSITDDRIELTLQLKYGVVVRGRVVDADGNGLRDVSLTTGGPHGRHSGRSATSGDGGQFQFMAISAGSLTVHPDARLLDENGQVRSRDVQAVFASQAFTIPAGVADHEIVIAAEPHTEIVFDWIDRRKDKTQAIAYYGAFRVRGHMPDADGNPSTYWTSETERVERDGKTVLVVKVPKKLLKPVLVLPADRKVTASYSDSTGVKSGPGSVQLGDINAKVSRTVYGDESKSPVKK